MKIFQLFRGPISSQSSRASSASSSSCSASISAASLASVTDGDYNEEEGDLNDEEEITDWDELVAEGESQSVSDSCTDRSQSYTTDESQTSTDGDDDDDDDDDDDSFRWQKNASVSVLGSMSFNKSKSLEEADRSNKMQQHIQHLRSPLSRCQSEEGEEVVIEEGDDEEDVDDEDNYKEAEETELEEDGETDSTDSSMPTIPSVLHTTMSKEVLTGYRPKNGKYTRTSTTGRIDIDDVINNWKSMEKQLLLGGVGDSGEAEEKEQHSVKFCDDVTLPPVDLDELRAVLERDDKDEIERLYDAIVKNRTTNMSEESESDSTSDDNDSKTSSSKLQSKYDIPDGETSNYIEVIGSIETYDSLASKICKIEHLVDWYASLEGASTLLTTMGGSSKDVDDDGRQPHKDVVAEVQSELTQRLLTNNAAVREVEKVENMLQTEGKTKKKVEKFARSKRPSGKLSLDDAAAAASAWLFIPDRFKVVAEVQSELTQRLLTNNSAVREEKTGRIKTKKKVGGIFESAAAFVVTGKYRNNVTTKTEQPAIVVVAAVAMKPSDIVVNIAPSMMLLPSPEPSFVNDSPTQDEEGKRVMNTSKVTSLPRTRSMTGTADTAYTINGIEVEGNMRIKSFQPFRDKDNESTKSSRLRETVDSHKKDEIVESDRSSLHLSRLVTRLDSEEGGSLWDDDISRKSKTLKRLILEDGANVPTRMVESPKNFEDAKNVTKKSSCGGVDRKSRMGASPSSQRLHQVSEGKEYASPSSNPLVKPAVEDRPLNPEKIQGLERTCEESGIEKSKRRSGTFTDTFPLEKFVNGKKEESKSVKVLEVKIEPDTIVDNHNASTKTPEIEVAGDSNRVAKIIQPQQQHGIANSEKKGPQKKETYNIKRFMSPMQSLQEKQQLNVPLCPTTEGKKKTFRPTNYFKQSMLLSKSKGFIATVKQYDSEFIAKARNKDTMLRPVVKSSTHDCSITTENASNLATVKTPSKVIKVVYTPRISKIGSPRMKQRNNILNSPTEKTLPEIKDKVGFKSTSTIEIRTVDARDDDNPDDLSLASNNSKEICDEKRKKGRCT